MDLTCTVDIGIKFVNGCSKNRASWDEYFFDIAKSVSSRATCPRKRVGAVIVGDKKILATGFNGAKSGAPHCTDVGCNIKSNHCTRAVHAEINALQQYLQPINAIRILTDGEGLTMYVTLQPCKKCKKELDIYLPKMKILYLEEYDNI